MSEGRITRFDLTVTPLADSEAARHAERMMDQRGCRECGVISITGPHVCEHGVIGRLDIQAEATVEVDRDMYNLIFGRDDETP